MTRAIALATLCILSLPAVGQQRPWPNYLIELQGKADELCRGYPGEGRERDQICQIRDDATRRLRSMGVCYGLRGQISAEMRWHWCNAQSQQR